MLVVHNRATVQAMIALWRRIGSLSLAVPLLLACGCASLPRDTGNLDQTDHHTTVASSATAYSTARPAVLPASAVLPANSEGSPEEGLIQPAAMEEVVPSGDKLAVAPAIQVSSPSDPLAAVGTLWPPPTANDELTLAELEELAFAQHPAIAQAAARVRALRGKWQQAGLGPNPTAGYLAEEIGDEGTAGKQGGFVSQQWITAHKLPRDQAVVAAEIDRAEQQLVATQTKVQTDLRHAYYLALLAQRKVQLAEELVHITGAAVDASQALVDAEEIPLAGLLQTEVQQQNAVLLLQVARNAEQQAWRKLAAVVSLPELVPQPLAGDVTQLPQTLDWQEQLVRLQSESPEAAAAVAELQRSRRALRRACVEPVPNITTQVGVLYDNVSGDTLTAVQVGLPLPLWNRNQGGIRQAQAEITAAVRNLERVEQDLAQRLADAFRDYADAEVTARSYARDILPRAEKTLHLVRQGYEQGEVGYLDLFTAQQTYSQTNLAYLDALGKLWQSFVRIDGLLLEGSLGPLH